MTRQQQSAWAALDEAETVAGRSGDVASAALVGAHHLTLLLLGDSAAAVLEAAPEAIARAREAGRPDLLAICLNYTGSAQVLRGDESGLAALRESLAIAVDMGAEDLAGRAYNNLAYSLWMLTWMDELDATVEEALAYSAVRDLTSTASTNGARRPRRCCSAGATTRPRRCSTPCTPTSRIRGCSARCRSGFPGCCSPGAACRAPSSGSRRCWTRRCSSRTASSADVRATPEPWSSGAGWTTASRCAARSPTPSSPVRWPDLDAAELVRWLLRAGLIERDAVAPIPGLPEAHAAGWRGDWRAAADAWKRVGAPYERALELIDSGDVDATLEGIAVLDALDAAPAARIGRQRLRDLGVARVPRGPVSTTRSNPAGLTERQLDVLALLADGLTNGEIAARLVVSTRTVDHHVSAVLAKLGVTTRREAARRARELRDG